MKTTIDIAEPVLRAAKEVAARRSTTLRELIEGQLRQVIEEDARRGSFTLEELPVRGGGLLPEFESRDWARIRDEIYRGQGGA
jgi:hypothetical protein